MRSDTSTSDCLQRPLPRNEVEGGLKFLDVRHLGEDNGNSSERARRAQNAPAEIVR